MPGVGKDFEMKCIFCILEALKNKLVGADPEPVQLAVDSAQDAVTVYDLRPVCATHLHRQIVGSALKNWKK